jgi:hypothetical protein
MNMDTLAGHACAFFDSEAAEMDARLALADGCRSCGDKCIHFVAASASGPDALTWDETYLREGRFDLDAMLAMVARLVDDEHARQRPLRAWADMGWCHLGAPGSERLVEYESRINTVLHGGTDLVVCAYDVRRLAAGMVLDLLGTHPYVFAGGSVRRNPMYVPTERFLREYRARQAH